MEKIEALKQFIGEGEKVQCCIDGCYQTTCGDFLVLTDDEANEKAREEILNSLWAFNSDFIAEHISGVEYDALKKAIELMQSQMFEDCNKIIERLIDDFEEFAQDAISADGRGHFLAGYDFEENEQDGFFIYRIN